MRSVPRLRQSPCPGHHPFDHHDLPEGRHVPVARFPVALWDRTTGLLQRTTSQGLLCNRLPRILDTTHRAKLADRRAITAAKRRGGESRTLRVVDLDGWPLTRSSGKRSEPIVRKPLDQQVDRLASRSALFEGTLLLPGMLRRLAFIEVNQFHRQARLGGANSPCSVKGQTPEQVVRAAVVEALVRASQDVHVSSHRLTRD